MDENEEFYSKILAIFTAILFIFISIITFIFIGLTKVEAKSYAWDAPFRTEFRQWTSATAGIDSGTLIIRKSYDTFMQNLDSELISNALNIRYSIGDNNVNEDTTVTPDKYYISFRFRIAYFSTSGGTPQLSRLKLRYYRPGLTDYNVMTCDGEETFTATPMGTSGKDYIVDYSCSELSFNQSDISHVAYSYYANSPMTIWQNSQNFYMISTSENATNNDIISNNDKNTENIMNNQNENTDKVVNALEGEDLTEEEKKPVNKEDWADYQEKENELLKEDNLNGIYDIEIGLDTNTLDYIWELVTRILQTHTMIYGLVISILSIGIIKLILNR